MKGFIILIFIGYFLSCISIKQIPKFGLLKKELETEPLVCSYNCNSTYNFLRANCTIENALLRKFPIASNDVDPYAEFDALVAMLKKDAANPYPLSYKFTSCASVCNAASTLVDNKIQVIYYNQGFLNGLKGDNENKKWAIRCIIAHEIGHHFLGHTFMTGNISSAERRKMEKKADFFCGFVISKYSNSRLQDAQQGLLSLDPTTYMPQSDAQENGSIYPTIKNRMQAVKEGFEGFSNTNLEIAMFKQIDSVAEAYYKEFGRSTIYRTLDKEIAENNLLEAKEKVNKFLKDNQSFEEKDLLLNQKAFIYELLNNEKQAIRFQREAVNFNPNRLENLERLQNLLEKGNMKQKKEAVEIQQKINSIQK